MSPKLSLTTSMSSSTSANCVITFLGIVPFKPQGSGKYLKGWYKESEPKMYISKGIGTSILPIRFGARAEMVEMEI